MVNKRGQGLSVNAIILIILGVIVLAVLIIGFTMGWGTFTAWLGGDNLSKINTECRTACTTNSQADFCSKLRTVRIDQPISDTIKDKARLTIAASPSSRLDSPLVN